MKRNGIVAYAKSLGVEQHLIRRLGGKERLEAMSPEALAVLLRKEQKKPTSS